MTAKPVASIEQLLRASSDDEETLQYPLPDSGFGFHAQQAVEKLYKVLLAFRNGQYPFSHDLKSLRNRVEAAGFTLPTCSFRLEDLSEYLATPATIHRSPFLKNETLVAKLHRRSSLLRSQSDPVRPKGL